MHIPSVPCCIEVVNKYVKLFVQERYQYVRVHYKNKIITSHRDNPPCVRRKESYLSDDDTDLRFINY